jgi:ketosteroid isomerase-like protein
MSLEDNKALVRRYIDIWQGGDVDALDALVAPGYVGHVATGTRDLDGLKDRIRALRAAIPGIVFTVEAQVAEGDMVTTRVSARGTHASSGQPTRLSGLYMTRIEAGRLAEEWAAWETVV